MKIDGMHGNDQRKSSRKADPSDFQVLIHIQFTLAGLEVNRPIKMQDSEIIHVRRAQTAISATLCYVNARSRPRLVSVAICAVAGRAGRSRSDAKEIGKVLDSLVNQFPLMIGGQDFPHRDFVLFVTFAVIAFTLLGLGTTLSPLVQALGIARIGLVICLPLE